MLTRVYPTATKTDMCVDNWLTAQLILISPNRIAQHWLEWGHFSFYERVDIDKFTGI